MDAASRPATAGGVRSPSSPVAGGQGADEHRKRLPVAGLGSDAQRALHYQDHSARGLQGRSRGEEPGDVARRARDLNMHGSIGVRQMAKAEEERAAAEEAARIRGVTDDDLERARDEFNRVLFDEDEARGYDRPRSSPYEAHTQYRTRTGWASSHVRVAGELDADLAYEQARRNAFREAGLYGAEVRADVVPAGARRYPTKPQRTSPGYRPGADVRYDSYRPALNASEERIRGMRLDASVATRSERPDWLKERLDMSRTPTGTSAEATGRGLEDSRESFELRVWYPGPRQGRAEQVAQVDALETSLRKLVEQLEVAAGSRQRAMRRLVADFPAASHKLYSDGLSPAGLEDLLCSMRVQWATPQVVRALFARYDIDGSQTLTAAELEAMLFKTSEGSRARVTLGRVREALAARGASGNASMVSTIKQFRIFDKDGSKSIDRDEFRRGMDLCLKGTDIWPLSRVDEDALFRTFDRNGDGRVAFEEFARAVRAPLPEGRERIVLRAYDKLCSFSGADGDYGIPLAEIARQYDAAMHPKVKEGKSDAGKVLEAFLAGFDKDHDEIVTLEEFVEYYTWLSWGVPDDGDFRKMVTRSLQLQDVGLRAT